VKLKSEHKKDGRTPDLTLRRVKCSLKCCANCVHAEVENKDIVAGHGESDEAAFLVCTVPSYGWYRYVRDLDVCGEFAKAEGANTDNGSITLAELVDLYQALSGYKDLGPSGDADSIDRLLLSLAVEIGRRKKQKRQDKQEAMENETQEN
jgi:hypothetical protein